MIWLLLACAGSGDTDTDTPEDLLRTLPSWGEYGAGYAATEVSYDNPGLDEGAPDTRTLHLAVFYPSSEDTLGEEVTFQDVFPGEDIGLDAAWADTPEGGFPVALFSHGHQGYAENSSFLMAHLASHGWVVLAPNHEDNTFFDGSERATDIYLQRPRDLTAVLDAAFGGELGLPALDEDTLVAMGHSFGGYSLFASAGGVYDTTVIEACLDGSDTSAFCSTMTEEHAAVLEAGYHEDRIRAWLPMASGDYRLFGADGLGAVDEPVMLMSGELDGQAGNSDDYQAALPDSPDNRHARLLGGGHQTFTDFSGILESGDDLITAEEADPIIDALVLAFLRRHGLEDSSVQPVLDGELVISDQVEWR